jgi:glutathione S-transferase
MKLYCFPRSGNSREVKIVLAEKNVPFEPVNVHGDPAVKESPEFKKASPKGKVPAIVDGDVYMSEAFLINQYLEKKYPQPSLLPPDPARRVEIEKFVNEIDKSFVLQIGLLVIECLLKPKEQQKEEIKQAQRAKIVEGLKKLDAMLEGKEYLFGEFSLADVAVTPHIAALPILGSGIPAELKNANAWFERIKKRPSFAASQG